MGTPSDGRTEHRAESKAFDRSVPPRPGPGADLPPARSGAIALAYAEARFCLRAESSGRLPGFLGTTLRGALGHHLRATACHDATGACEECLLRETCVYSILFLGQPPAERRVMRKYPAIPQPFVILVPWGSNRTPGAGTLYDFGWRLFGPAAAHFPILVFTMRRIAEAGLGRERLPFALVEVADSDGRCLYRESESSLARPPERRVSWPGGAHLSDPRVILRLHTPLRLRYGERLCRRFHLPALLIGLLRRLQILGHFYGVGAIEDATAAQVYRAAEAARVICDRTRWVEIERTSGRQKTRMSLGGVIGDVLAEVPDGMARSLLKIGEVTHAGKATSFGFGRFTVEGA